MSKPTDLPIWCTTGDDSEPSGGKKAAGFVPAENPPAQDFNWLFNTGYQWDVYLDAITAGTETVAAMVITALVASGATIHGVTTMDSTSSSSPMIDVTQGAHTHPSSSSNRWKLFLRGAGSDGTKVLRMFLGEGDFGDGSQWCITSNAAWDPAASGSGGQKWSKDDTGKEANYLRVQAGSIAFYGRSGGGTWDDNQWGAQNRGNLFIGDTVEANHIHSRGDAVIGSGGSGSLEVNGFVTIKDVLTVGDDGSGTLEVNGSGTFKDGLTVGDDGSGNLDVQGTATTTGNVVVGFGTTASCTVNGNIYANADDSGEFLYSGTLPLREVVYTMSGGSMDANDSNFDYSAANETITTGGRGTHASWVVPIHLANGCQIHDVLCQGNKNTSNLTWRLIRQIQPDWSASPAAASNSIISSASSSTAGLRTVTINAGDYTVDNTTESYSIEVLSSTNSATGDIAEKFKVRFYDVGPRNF